MVLDALLVLKYRRQSMKKRKLKLTRKLLRELYYGLNNLEVYKTNGQVKLDHHEEIAVLFGHKTKKYPMTCHFVRYGIDKNVWGVECKSEIGEFFTYVDKQ